MEGTTCFCNHDLTSASILHSDRSIDSVLVDGAAVLALYNHAASLPSGNVSPSHRHSSAKLLMVATKAE